VLYGAVSECPRVRRMLEEALGAADAENRRLRADLEASTATGPSAVALRRECEKYGLPVNFDALMRHIENNHAATYGAQRFTVDTLREQRDELYDALDALMTLLGGCDRIDTTDEAQGEAARLLVSLKRARELSKEQHDGE
jgi:hypothetical protein